MDPQAQTDEAKKKSNFIVLILDCGSQYTQLLIRKIRSLSVMCQCVSLDINHTNDSNLKCKIIDFNPTLIILSGGPHSLHEPKPPSFPDWFLDYIESRGIHLLGICYGMNLILHKLGGEVVVSRRRRRRSGGAGGNVYCYESTEIEVVEEACGGLFGNKSNGYKQVVWMGHGDEILKLPQGFVVAARSTENGSVAAVVNKDRRFYGLQYHPHEDVTLKHILFNVCGITPSWKMQMVMGAMIKHVKNIVGPENHVLCLLCGGVESSLAATLVHKAIGGDRLHCVFIDNGLLRYKERERVMETFERDLQLPLNVVTFVDAKQQFLRKLKGVVDPEKKKKIIEKEFFNTFRAFARDLEKKQKPTANYFLLQGTVFPDFFAFCPPPGTTAACSKYDIFDTRYHIFLKLRKDIKKLEVVEPFPLLIKDEVRELGRLLNVPEDFLKRQPFPVHGLALRVLGDVTKGNALDILRQVDEIFIQSIKDAGIYDSMEQAFAEFLPLKSVGVQGDKKTHSHVVALRAVTTQDGITTEWYKFEQKFLDDVARKICNEVAGVNRVVQDIASNPPSPIGWEY